MMQYLLNIPDVDVNQCDSQGNSALTLICGHESFPFASDEKRQFSIVKLLLKCDDIEVNHRGAGGRTALICAALWLRTRTMRLLLKHPRVLVNLTYGPHSDRTALLQFIYLFGNDNGVLGARQLLNHPDINVNYVDNSGITVHSLTLNRCKFIMHALLNHGKI
jgi:ankyrin repeat protein